jgi:hypothetical protein
MRIADSMAPGPWRLTADHACFTAHPFLYRSFSPPSTNQHWPLRDELHIAADSANIATKEANFE